MLHLSRRRALLMMQQNPPHVRRPTRSGYFRQTVESSERRCLTRISMSSVPSSTVSASSMTTWSAVVHRRWFRHLLARNFRLSLSQRDVLLLMMLSRDKRTRHWRVKIVVTVRCFFCEKSSLVCVLLIIRFPLFSISRAPLSCLFLSQESPHNFIFKLIHCKRMRGILPELLREICCWRKNRELISQAKWEWLACRRVR